jgi:hypothetical protein
VDAGASSHAVRRTGSAVQRDGRPSWLAWDFELRRWSRLQWTDFDFESEEGAVHPARLHAWATGPDQVDGVGSQAASAGGPGHAAQGVPADLQEHLVVPVTGHWRAPLAQSMILTDHLKPAAEKLGLHLSSGGTCSVTATEAGSAAARRLWRNRRISCVIHRFPPRICMVELRSRRCVRWSKRYRRSSSSSRSLQPLHDPLAAAIWRRIELSSQTTLKQLHRILQIAMGWENCHLHEYIVDGRRYGTADPAYDGPGRSFARQAFVSRRCCPSLVRRSSMSMISETTGNTVFDWKQFSRRSRG